MAPFLQSKWATLLRIQSEVEMVKDAAETAAEVVEEVAAAVEKASAEVAEAEQLPEHGALRRAAALVERASREVAEEAHLAHDIIHKRSKKSAILPNTGLLKTMVLHGFKQH
ncbi:hypothetical protein OsJ_31308 [Oryza sativa Japonica Group]|uniref:Uncharacterized protein n=1 Tax=Oryza sativa subsp. japonica TaxID=39947 RepID=B9G5G3_ORYSJ|nr:hypothetical protein OsJ_31308 [Oryza sativa Japonica Group]